MLPKFYLKSPILLFVVLLCFLAESNAQTNRFIPYKLKQDVWIYVKPASNKPIIEEEFQAAQPFNYLGFAKVKLDEKWQWIDTTGKHVFTEYDSLNYLQNKDLYIAYKKGKCGIVSGLNRAVLVPLEFDEIQVIKFGDPEMISFLSVVSPYPIIDLIGSTKLKGKTKSKLIQIDLDGKIKTRVKYSEESYESIAYSDLDLKNFDSRLFLVTSGNFMGLLSANSKVIVPPIYEEIQLVDRPKNGRKTVAFSSKNERFLIVTLNQNQGLYNSEGQQLVKPVYKSVSPLENCSLPIFRLQNKSDLQGLYFAETNQTIEPKYITMNYLYNVNAVVCRDKKWIDFYNQNGIQVLSNLESSEFKKIANNTFKYLSVKGLYGLMQGNSKVLLAAEYDEIKGIGSDKLVAIRKKEKWAFYNVVNQQLSGFDYKHIGMMTSSGLLPASNDQLKFGFLNEKVNWVIQPKYSSASSFNEGSNGSVSIADAIQLAAVSINGKFGYIDVKGNLFTQLEYDSAQGFSGQMSAVKTKNGWQVIGKGKKPMSRFYKQVKILSGVAIIHHKDSSGVLDFEGKWIFPMTKSASYTIIDHSSDNFPFQRIHDNVSFTQVGIVNGFGKLILKLDDFTIENLDSTHWLLLGKKQSAVIHSSGEISPLNVSGVAFEWLNSKHTIGVFKNKNGTTEKLKYFNALNYKLASELDDLVIEFDEETEKIKVSKNGKLGIFTQDLQLLLPANYSEIKLVNPFMNDLFIVKNYNGNYGVINRRNEFKIAFANQFIYSKSFAIEKHKGACDAQIICVKKADRIDYYNQLSQLIYSETIDLNRGFSAISDSLFEIVDSDKNTLYFVDAKGFKYERVK